MGRRLFTVLLVVLATSVGCENEPASGSAARDAGPPSGDRTGAPHVLVGYYSRTGHTEKMAAAVADGVRSVAGVTMSVKPVAEITREDLEKADGLVLGAPTYYANVPGEMMTVIESWPWKMKVDFTNRVGGAFATGGESTGGQEHVVLSLLRFMLNNRMIVVGPLHETPTARFGAMGATAVTGRSDPGVGDREQAHARKLGHRVATITRRLHGRK
jgi:NAD(P)H dehydrogenase (quinone)